MGVEALLTSKLSSFYAFGAPPSTCNLALELVFEDGGSKRAAKSKGTRRKGNNSKCSTTSSMTPIRKSGCFLTSKDLSSCKFKRRASLCRSSFTDDSSSSSSSSSSGGGEDAVQFGDEEGYGYGTARSGFVFLMQGEGIALLEGQRDGDGQSQTSSPPPSSSSSSSSSSRGPSFGLGGPFQSDEFQWTPSPSFGEGFESRIAELRTTRGHQNTSSQSMCGELKSSIVESPHAEGEAPSVSNSESNSQTRDDAALCNLRRAGGVQLPTSIRKLKRRKDDMKMAARLDHLGCECSIRKAFSSMVYMIKAMQSYALQIRKALFSEWDVQEVMMLVHHEMHSSFVWLFQQVFACTPKLMMSVMILLANFTAFSMGENMNIAIASAVFETPAPISQFLRTYHTQEEDAAGGMYYTTEVSSILPLLKNHSTDVGGTGPDISLGGGSGGHKSRQAPVAGDDEDGDSWRLQGGGSSSSSRQSSMYSKKDTYGARPSGLNPRNPQQKATPQRQQQEPPRPSDREVFKALLEQTAKELELKSGEPLQHVQLDQETIRTLVAPIVANVEPDNYPCFDRTDLEYQHAISKDPSSSLLLANYAQFLYVVRHDNNRAEEFFHRAMRVDPLDAAVLGRFASFFMAGTRKQSSRREGIQGRHGIRPRESVSCR